MNRLLEKLRLPGLSLNDERHWQGALLFVFLLAVICRFLAFVDLAGHPVGSMHEWTGTEPWFYFQKAQEVAMEGNWLLEGPNLLVDRGTLRQAPDLWQDWMEGRLPRGSLAIYLMAASFSLTGTLAVYTFAAILAGGILAVGIASITAGFFSSRRAGAIAGILAASHQSLVLATLTTGPWLWEGVALVAILGAFLRLRDRPGEILSWILPGLALGFGIWMRSFFFWGVLLAPLAIWLWKIPISPRQGAAAILPLLILAVALCARNDAADGNFLPIVGHPAWAFSETVHPRAERQSEGPPDLAVMMASEGRFLHAVGTTLDLKAYRGSIPAVLSIKLRRFLGARDAAGAYNPSYIRRQSEMLRLTTLRPDATMAAGWAGLLFLLFLRRLPWEWAALLGLLVLHALFFYTGAGDRVLLHLAAMPVMAAAIVLAWDTRLLSPVVPFVYIALWAAMHLGLQIDDQARGSRYRQFDFKRSARLFLRMGERQEARLEMMDYEQIRRLEREFRMHWYQQR